MEISFECTKCGQEIVIDEVSSAFRSVECPSCGETMFVGCAAPPQLPSLNLGEQIEYKIENGWLMIGLDFQGQCSCSPNGRFVLTWREGFHLLLDDNRVIAKGEMQSPNDGKVADNGNFILNDWGSENLSGTFWAFAASGEVLIRKRFRANLDTNGISDNGRFAFCDTCRSDCEAHSDKTFVFDLEARTLLARCDGWAGATQPLEHLEAALRLNPQLGVDALKKCLRNKKRKSDD